MYIYIITHPNYSDWVKVGITKDIYKRFNNYQTYCPYRHFKLEFNLITNRAAEIESYFKHNIKNNGYEWFNCSVEYAISIIQNQAGMTGSISRYKMLSKKIAKQLPSDYIQLLLVRKYDYIIDGRKYEYDDLVNIIGNDNLNEIYYYIRKGDRTINLGKYEINATLNTGFNIIR